MHFIERSTICLQKLYAVIKPISFFLLFLIAIIVGGCAYLSSNYVKGETAYFKGKITVTSKNRLFQMIAGKKITKLVLDCVGGDVNSAIEIGYWIFNNQINIQVDGNCLSSCANYLFPAGKNKYISPTGLLGWHGNIQHLQITGKYNHKYDINPNESCKMNRQKTDKAADIAKTINNLIKREQKFYKLIGVDEYVCYVGKMSPYNAYNFFTLSPQDMQYFGIDSVTVADNYFKKIIAYQKKYPEKPFIQYIELDPKIVEGNRPKPETTRPVKDK